MRGTVHLLIINHCPRKNFGLQDTTIKEGKKGEESFRERGRRV